MRSGRRSGGRQLAAPMMATPSAGRPMTRSLPPRSSPVPLSATLLISLRARGPSNRLTAGTRAPRARGGGRRRRRQPELREDARDVLLDRADGEHERRGDAGVRAALRHQPEHLALARRQPSSGPSRRRAKSCATTSGSSAVPPAATRRTASTKSSTSHDAVLQQVADAAARRRRAAPPRTPARRTARR